MVEGKYVVMKVSKTRDVIHCRFAVVITKKVSRMRHLKISGSAPPISVDIEEA